MIFNKTRKLVMVMLMAMLVLQWAGLNSSNVANAEIVEGKSNKIMDIAGGAWWHSLILKEDGTVWAWGTNDSGQLGDGTNESKSSPVEVVGLSNIVDVEAGGAFSLALDKNGNVWSWGDNQYGQLGDGTTENRNYPVQVKGISNVIALAGGGEHVLAIKKDGTVWTWGNNSAGQLGYKTEGMNPTPSQVPGLSNVLSIGAGAYHSVALKADGTVWSWGSNSVSQLGNGGSSIRSMQQAIGVSNIVEIAVGGNHTLALAEDGSVWVWGYNQFGHLGNATTEDNPTPEKMEEMEDVAAVAAGGHHSLVLKKDGTVWSWGYNNHGQLGNGTKTMQLVPIQVDGMKNVAQIAGEGFHTLALTEDGSLWGWGANYNGQLGDGTKVDKLTPIKLISVNTDKVEVDTQFNVQVEEKDITATQEVPKNVHALSGAFTITAERSLQPRTKISISVDMEKLNGVDTKKVAIWKLDETKNTWASIGGKVSLIEGKVTSTIDEAGTYAVMVSNQTFPDIAGHTYQYEIEVLMAQGIVKGFNENEFKPNNGVTRAEFAKMIVMAANLPIGNEKAAFKDVDGTHWATRFIAAAVKSKVITGYNEDTFGIKDSITREQAATIVQRTGNIDTLNFSLVNELIAGLADGNSIASYAKKPVGEAIHTNMIALENGQFNPKQTASRAVVAKMMVELMVNMGYLN